MRKSSLAFFGFTTVFCIVGVFVFLFEGTKLPKGIEFALILWGIILLVAIINFVIELRRDENNAEDEKW